MKKTPIQSDKNLFSDYSTSIIFYQMTKVIQIIQFIIIIYLILIQFLENKIYNKTISNNYNIIYHKNTNSKDFNTINNISRITLSPVIHRKKLSKKDLNFYKNIFKEKPIFKSKSKLINNTLNLIYSDNEKKFEEIIDMENSKMRYEK